jgi:hypothetical protein
VNRDDDGTLPADYVRAETGDGPCGGDPQPYDLALTQEPGDDR